MSLVHGPDALNAGMVSCSSAQKAEKPSAIAVLTKRAAENNRYLSKLLTDAREIADELMGETVQQERDMPQPDMMHGGSLGTLGSLVNEYASMLDDLNIQLQRLMEV